jgi:uncharacterized protein YdiU (UPF0061 family)
MVLLNRPLAADLGLDAEALDSDYGAAILARLAEAMLPLLERHWMDGMRAKLGLFDAQDEDRMLVDDLLQWMQRTGADYTNTFRVLSTADATPTGSVPGPGSGADATFAAWHQRWQARATCR